MLRIGSVGSAARILRAGVTACKGLEETAAKSGQWIAIPGIGGLGRMAVRHAKVIGLHVAVLRIAEDKLRLGGSTAPSSPPCPTPPSAKPSG